MSVRSPIFRSQSPCTYIYVQESQWFGNFVRIYTYESRKGLSDYAYIKVAELNSPSDGNGAYHH